jgi:2-iminobutanoate/2-iminopropanoate deaminase
MKAGKTIVTIALGIMFVGGLAAADDRTYYDGRSATDENVPPFSGSVMTDGTLYVSGQLGLTDGKVPATAEEEARNVMNAVKAQVESAGMTMNDVVFVQIFCSDVEHYGAFNGVYRTYFTEEYPARAFIGSGKLLFGARFEVLATAVKK